MRSVSDFDSSNAQCSIEKYVEAASVLDHKAINSVLEILDKMGYPIAFLGGMFTLFLVTGSFSLFYDFDRKCIGNVVKVSFIVCLVLLVIVGSVAGSLIAQLDEQASAIEDLYEQMPCFNDDTGTGDMAEWHKDMYIERCNLAYTACIFLIVASALYSLPPLVMSIVSYCLRDMKELEDVWGCC